MWVPEGDRTLVAAATERSFTTKLQAPYLIQLYYISKVILRQVYNEQSRIAQNIFFGQTIPRTKFCEMILKRFASPNKGCGYSPRANHSFISKLFIAQNFSLYTTAKLVRGSVAANKIKDFEPATKKSPLHSA